MNDPSIPTPPIAPPKSRPMNLTPSRNAAYWAAGAIFLAAGMFFLGRESVHTRQASAPVGQLVMADPLAEFKTLARLVLEDIERCAMPDELDADFAKMLDAMHLARQTQRLSPEYASQLSRAVRLLATEREVHLSRWKAVVSRDTPIDPEACKKSAEAARKQLKL